MLISVNKAAGAECGALSITGEAGQSGGASPAQPAPTSLQGCKKPRVKSAAVWLGRANPWDLDPVSLLATSPVQALVSSFSSLGPGTAEVSDMKPR